MKTYWIGRRKEMDIRINHPSMSGMHAELVEGNDGRFHITDCASTNGLYLIQGNSEKPIKQSYIDIDDGLILGEVETTVRKLLALAGKVRQDNLQSRVVRNRETGEVEGAR